MLVKGNHRINPKTGEIYVRERVTIRCEGCSSLSQTTYGDYKRRKVKPDLCMACRNRKGINGTHSGTHLGRISSTCDFCSAPYVTSHNKYRAFCSRKCADTYRSNTKYHKILTQGKELEDEIAYLLGLIMGDGSLSTIERVNTKRVYIYFNNTDLHSITVARNVLKVLDLHHVENMNRSSCLCFQLTLPNNTLAEWGINFSGSKYRTQPKVNPLYVGNVNFVAGLINSDGYFYKRSSRTSPELRFQNTVESIVEDMKTCLDANSINYTTSRINSPNPREKEAFVVGLYTGSAVQRLRELLKYPLKEPNKVK